MSTNGHDPRAAYTELKSEESALKVRAEELLGRLRSEDRTRRVDAAAEALLDGTPLDDAVPDREELDEVRASLRVTQRAIEIQRAASSRTGRSSSFARATQ